MMTFRNILSIGIIAVPLFALFDLLFIGKPAGGNVSFISYLIICSFEYSLFWIGYWAGDTKKKEGDKKIELKDYIGFILSVFLIIICALVILYVNRWI